MGKLFDVSSGLFIVEVRESSLSPVSCMTCFLFLRLLTRRWLVNGRTQEILHPLWRELCHGCDGRVDHINSIEIPVGGYLF